MQEAWAIREINDEVIKISKQFGVKNIIHYGGPGITENGEPIDNFNKYKDLNEKLKSENLNLVGVESGFWTSWYQVAGSMFGFPAIDTFGFCHNVRVFKDYTDIDESDLTAMSIAPNPANDYLKINFNKAVVTEEFIGRIKVYNVIGNEVYVHPNIEASNTVGFEVSSLPGGNYWITIDLGVGTLREEFVIVH